MLWSEGAEQHVDRVGILWRQVIAERRRDVLAAFEKLELVEAIERFFDERARGEARFSAYDVASKAAYERS
jgi:hypothetical protein